MKKLKKTKIQLTECEIPKILLLLIILASAFQYLVNAEDQYQTKLTIRAHELLTYEEFGGAVFVHEDLILIGAPKGSSGGTQKAGKVYIFNTNGELLNIIESPNPEANAKFGNSLVTDGEYIVIGACDETVELESMAGKVYVFDKSGELIYELQSPEPGTKGHFGGFLRLNGDMLLVSEEYILLDELDMSEAAQDTAADAESNGKVYIYDINGTLKLTLEDKYKEKATLYGVGSDFNDEYIVVGEVKSNRVQVYDNQGSHLTTIETPQSWMNLGLFGISTAISDDLIVIGDYRVNLVHLYDAEGNQLNTITPPTGHEGDFGYYVDIDRNLIVISEPKGDVDGVEDAGYVFIYDTDGNMISMIHSPDPQKRGRFGGGTLPRNCVSISGERIVVGEPGAEIEGVSRAGRAHIIEKGSFTVTVSDLSIDPSSVEPGETVTCSVKCSNSGTFPGQYKVTLKIDDEVTDEKTVSLGVGGSKTVDFEVVTQETGEFSVDVNGEAGSFEVKEAQSAQPAKPEVPGFPIAALVTGTLIMSIIMVSKRRLCPLF